MYMQHNTSVCNAPLLLVIIKLEIYTEKNTEKLRVFNHSMAYIREILTCKRFFLNSSRSSPTLFPTKYGWLVYRLNYRSTFVKRKGSLFPKRWIDMGETGLVDRAQLYPHASHNISLANSLLLHQTSCTFKMSGVISLQNIT